jgi:hypothetical protein
MMKRTGAVLAGAIVGAVVLSPVIPAQAVDTDPLVPAWKLSFVPKTAVTYVGPSCTYPTEYNKAEIAMSGRAGYRIVQYSETSYIESRIKIPGKSWTSPKRLKNPPRTLGPSSTFATVQVKKAGKYKVSLRKVLKNKGAVAPEPELTYGQWSAPKKLKLTASKIRQTKSIRTKVPLCK